MNIEIIGLMAGSFTTISFIPQVWKIITTKKTRDISLYMYCLFIMGLIFWEIFGIVNKSISIIIANSMNLFFATLILICKIKYK